MIANLFNTILGLIVLVIGGELLLRGAVKLAQLFKLTPAVIGLTVVAIGTSVPELAVSAIAAWKSQTDVAVGNVVGSNIFNLAFILGLTALYKPLSVTGNTIKLEFPALVLVTMLFNNLSKDGLIGRMDAALFIAIYVCFTAYLIRIVRKELTEKEEAQFKSEVAELESSLPSSYWIPGSLTVAGIMLLGFGAELTVSGAVEIGRALGMSERIIGLTIVSIGTSLPEIVTSLVSAYRGRNDIAIANVIGSNLFNILGILGLTAIITPLSVAGAIVSVDSWWLIGTTILIFPIMRTGFVISKREGAILLTVYLIYLLQLILVG